MPAKVAVKKSAKPAKMPAKKVDASKKVAKAAKAPPPQKAKTAPQKAKPAAKPEAPAKVEKTKVAPVAKPAGKAKVQETVIETAPVASPQVLAKKEKKEKKVKKEEPLVSSRGTPLDEEGEKLLKQWRQMQEQLKGTKPAIYTLQGNFEAKTAIQHKVLGWGYVLKNKENRIEVLFQDGVKTLVTNYKPA